MHNRQRKRAVVIAAATALLASSLSISAQAQGPRVPDNAVQGGKSLPKATSKPREVGKEDRAAVLGKNYSSSKDVALSTSGDGTGFHVLTGKEKDGYRFTTVATLREDGFDADTWIGNACVTGSGKYAAIAYAPRTFTNNPELMVRGAFTAVVDLGSGKVTKLPFTASLAYFSPGCGTTDDVVFTQLTYDGDEAQKSRLITVDAASGKESQAAAFPGQVTSAVPTRHGIVAGHGNKLVRIDGQRETVLAVTKHVPFQIAADSGGGVTFIDREADTRKTKARSWAKHLDSAQVKGRKTTPRTVAEGRLTDWDLSATPGGTVFLTGKAENTGTLPGPLKNPGHLAKGARMSSLGHAGVSTSWADGRTSLITPDRAKQVRDARITLDVVATGRHTEVDATPELSAGRTEDGSRLSPALGVPSGKKPSAKPSVSGDSAGPSTQTVRTQALTASPTGPGEGTDERYCAVARNDVKKQAFQPTPRQVEWAVDQAVVGELRFTRPANWKNTGMDSYSPQGLFPAITLAGDPNGTLDNEDPNVTDRWHVPSQVMLGVTAQESNMWQATRFAVPGVTSNSLIGNYYGTQYTADGTQADPWRVNFSEADCGYGITQATDGMRLAGKTKPGETALPPTTQEAVALDYAANIAYGVTILSRKWNDLHGQGMMINDGHPQWIENWFFALWAYNSGFYPAADSAGHKGLGWTNNPANPLWKANRVPFLQSAADPAGDDYSHAAHPQDWPYEEKVLGWAARPISAMFAPGDFRPGYLAAWWNSNAERSTVKPPLDTFCDASNSCDPSKIADGDSNDPGMGACSLDSGDSDTNPHWLHCWWAKSAKWKNCTTGAECGHQVHRFNTSYPEQPDANSYPPHCSTGLPSSALVVDDVPDGTTPAGSDARGCGAAKSDGTFTLTYQPSDVIDTETGKTVTTYPGKIDTHQIGAGHGNHFWFTHTRSPESYPPPGDRMKVTGTWTLGRKITDYGSQAKVYAFVPDHGAQTSAASYRITTQWGTETKTVSQQDNQSNKWVDLGSYRFGDVVPKVTLDNFNGGDGSADIAYDAVAFVPGDYSGIPDNGTFPAPDDTAPDPADYTTPQSIDEPFFTPGGGAALSARSAANTVTATTVSGDDTDTCSVTEKSITYNRTSACAYDDIKISSYDSSTGGYIGSATFNVRLSIHLDPNSGTIKEEATVKAVSLTDGIYTARFIFDAKCRGYCSLSTPQWTGSDTWTKGDPHSATYTRTITWDQGGTAGIKGDITPYWEANGSLNGSATKDNAVVEKDALVIRCDTKVKTTPGCVFGWYKPTYVMNTKKWSAAAAHAWLMQNKLPSHFGLRGQGQPLKYLGEEVMAPSDPTKTQRDVNRSTICGRTVDNFTPYLPQNGPGTALQSASDTVSCDEIAFAASYQSGGTPASIGGTNPVKTNGNECVQTYVGKRADGSWYIDLRADFPNPTWREGCGRSSMSARQNSGSMSAFGGAYGFSNKNRLMDGDEYWLDLNGFTL
ncbi:golvesin C-terminal-like domain-containing protein [Streptomyces sp. DSM 118148]|uniref:golvesin C-terminal-like domain-containing protein n=1 Tax=Streptomyces sp. DSM 118148 TaxID=3448667 RepID=UPI00404015CF